MTEVSAFDARAFSVGMRVYYEDTDAAGVVYYAGYLRFLERARTEWLRSLGFEQRELRDREGTGFAVRSLAIEYLKPARLDDLLNVTCEVESRRRAQLVFAQRVERGAELLVTASVRVACLDLDAMRAVPIPEPLARRIATKS